MRLCVENFRCQAWSRLCIHGVLTSCCNLNNDTFGCHGSHADDGTNSTTKFASWLQILNARLLNQLTSANGFAPQRQGCVFSPLCFLKCSFRPPFWPNAIWQPSSGQMKGLSPVCVLSCLSRSDFLWKLCYWSGEILGMGTFQPNLTTRLSRTL
jgi:hypothetical protein